MKFKKFILPIAISTIGLTTLSSCLNPFEVLKNNIENNAKVEDKYGDTKNTMFFALYNYYGQPGQNFTHRWLGMKQALEEYGIKITGDGNQPDARKFKIDYTNSTLPEDFKVFMVNNKTWDASLQYTKPLRTEKPFALVSTCNGVEFAAEQVSRYSPDTKNATMGGFSENYKKAFENGSLAYLATKYTCHVAPIFAAAVNAVLAEEDPIHYAPLRYPAEAGAEAFAPDGYALRLGLQHWDVKTYEEYLELEVMDNYTDNPTLKKSDLDPFFTLGNEKNSAEVLTEWCSSSSKDNIRAIYDTNREIKETPRQGRQLKAGIIIPSAVNDVVGAYRDYMKGYLAKMYNVHFVADQSVSSTSDQIQCTKNLIQNNVDFIISLQDDPMRTAAIKEANKAGVFFANSGTCQNDQDYTDTKTLKYFVGSIGSSNHEEQRVTHEMTKFYLDQIASRGPVKGK